MSQFYVCLGPIFGFSLVIMLCLCSGYVLAQKHKKHQYLAWNICFGRHKHGWRWPNCPRKVAGLGRHESTWKFTQQSLIISSGVTRTAIGQPCWLVLMPSPSPLSPDVNVVLLCSYSQESCQTDKRSSSQTIGYFKGHKVRPSPSVVLVTKTCILRQTIMFV